MQHLQRDTRSCATAVLCDDALVKQKRVFSPHLCSRVSHRMTNMARHVALFISQGAPKLPGFCFLLAVLAAFLRRPESAFAAGAAPSASSMSTAGVSSSCSPGAGAGSSLPGKRGIVLQFAVGSLLGHENCKVRAVLHRSSRTVATRSKNAGRRVRGRTVVAVMAAVETAGKQAADFELPRFHASARAAAAPHAHVRMSANSRCSDRLLVVNAGLLVKTTGAGGCIASHKIQNAVPALKPAHKPLFAPRKVSTDAVLGRKRADMSSLARHRAGSASACGCHTVPTGTARECNLAVQRAPPQASFTTASCSRPEWGHQRCTRCQADPGLMQDIIVGGAVTAAVGSAMFNGLKKSQVEMCDLCRGVGARQSVAHCHLSSDHCVAEAAWSRRAPSRTGRHIMYLPFLRLQSGHRHRALWVASTRLPTKPERTVTHSQWPRARSHRGHARRSVSCYALKH